MSEPNEVTEGARLLRAFLDARGLGPTAAAKALSCTHPAVIEWMSGTKRPAADARKVIAIWTAGEVPEESWMREKERIRLADTRPFSAPDEVRDGDDTGPHAILDCGLSSTGTDEG